MQKKEICQIILSHNKQNKLRFLKEVHKYLIDENLELQSVTQKKSKYFPFNVKKVARQVALRNWTVEEEIIQFWNSLRDYGTKIHDLAQKVSENQNLSLEEKEKIKSVIKFFKDHPQFEVILAEIPIFSRKYKMAGTIDLIVKDTNTNNLFTIDWKTSQKQIKKNDIWHMAKAPFEELPNNKFYNYSLQLSTYNLILKEEYNIQIYDSLIVRLLEDNYEIIEPINMDCEAEELVNL